MVMCVFHIYGGVCGVCVSSLWWCVCFMSMVMCVFCGCHCFTEIRLGGKNLPPPPPPWRQISRISKFMNATTFNSNIWMQLFQYQYICMNATTFNINIHVWMQLLSIAEKTDLILDLLVVEYDISVLWQTNPYIHEQVLYLYNAPMKQLDYWASIFTSCY